MRPSLPAPKRRASTNVFTRTSKDAVSSTAARVNGKETSQCRLPLKNRRNLLQGCSKKPLTELEKQTVGTNDLKSFEKQVPKAPRVLTDKNRRFSTGSFNLNSIRKVDTKFKMAARPKENPLNATYFLPRSDGKHTGQIPLKTKDLDVVTVQQCLPNISVANSIPECVSTQSAHFPIPLVEPSNLSPLLTSFVAEECLHIAAELINKRDICSVSAVGAINPVQVTNVSIINEESIPLDCSVYSNCSDTSPAKSLQLGCTSKSQENDFKDTSCQQIHTQIKTEDSSVSVKMNNDYIETGTLPCSSSGKLLPANETMLLSDHKDGALGAPKHEAFSRNVLSKPLTVSSHKSSLCPVDLIQLDGTIVLSDASNTPSLGTKHDAMPAKTLSNCKSPLSKIDLLTCDGTMLSEKNTTVVPKHRGSFGNELCKSSLSTGDLIQLNETMTVRDDKNATFDTSKQEGSSGNDLQEPAVSSCKVSLSMGDIVQLDGTMTVIDKNATFVTSKHEDSLGNYPNKVTALSNCKLSLSTEDIVQLNGTMTINDHKNTTFDASKHEGSIRNDASKATALSNCKLSLSMGDVIQLNGTVTDCKDATFDASKHEDSLQNDPNKTTALSNSQPSPPSGGSIEIIPLSSENLKLVRKCEGHQGSALDSVPELQRVECHAENHNSKDSNSTLNLGKGDDSTCTEKWQSEANQGGDGDVSCSAELHKGAPALVKHLRDPSQNKELNNCVSGADLVHDLVGSEWAPYCMSTPSSVAMKQSCLEYLPFDHSFQTSSSLQDDTHVEVVECPDKQVKTKDNSRSTSTDVTETKTCSRKLVNAPRPRERSLQTKVVTASASKPISNLPGARRKNINLAPVSEAQKCRAEKHSVPLAARTTRPDLSVMGRDGRPPTQPPSFSKMCLPKPRLVFGRLNSVIGTGKIAGNNNNKLASCQTGVNTNTKMPPRAEPNQLSTKAATQIPGLKRSPQTLSKLPVPETQKAESKQVELFNLGMGGPPSFSKGAHKSSALASKNIVTGIKRPGSAMEQKRRVWSSPKRSKAVGEVTAKFPKKSGTKPLSPLESKQKMGVKAGDSLTSEPKNKTAVEESESKQELEVAKLQRRIKELEGKVAMLELENAALRQQKENPTPVPEQESNI
ncbi:uncharacterized protein [Heptranchias perlo]|uniref:uncharacterized protein n=1 Tax=Heptranchias perlo TaxID=212740 RepID=UPI00355A8774